MKISRIFLFVVITLVFCMCDGGGGSGTGGGPEPAISSVEDANGTAIEPTGSTTTNPNSFRITFSEEMDEESVIAVGNIILSCGDMTPSITIALAADDADNGTTGDEYAIVVADAYRYQLLECLLTVSTSVKSMLGTAFSSAATYEFVNPCATSDDFNADSRSCWTIPPGESWGSWEEVFADGVLTFDTADGELDYSDANAGSGQHQISMVKLLIFDPSLPMEAVLKFSSLGLSANGDGIELTLQNESVESIVSIGAYKVAGNVICAILASGGMYQEDCSGISDIYIKMNIDNSALSASYSADGVDWAAIDGPPLPGWDDLPDTVDVPELAGFALLFRTAGTNSSASIDFVEIPGFM